MIAVKLITFLSVLVHFVGFVRADCNVVTRKQWGGIEPTQVRYLPRPLDLVIIAHTVTGTCSTDQKCRSIVQNIQAYHMDELDYFDVGPSFLVGGNGKVYEGPGWYREGAHTYGYNKRSIGISFIGNFMEAEPTPAQLRAVKDLLKCGVENGHLTSDFHVVGQRQLQATKSPGIKVYNEIRNWPEWLEDASSLKN